MSKACCASFYPGLSPSDGGLLDIRQDYTRVDFILSHVASHGCFMVVPDLAWTDALTETNDWGNRYGTSRALSLLSVLKFMQQINATLFSGVIDFTRVIVAGRSQGGAAALITNEHIQEAGINESAAVALVAPATDAKTVVLATGAGPLTNPEGYC